jgi:hypothetical protein
MTRPMRDLGLVQQKLYFFNGGFATFLTRRRTWDPFKDDFSV